jgi:hypothetical protein
MHVRRREEKHGKNLRDNDFSHISGRRMGDAL